MFKLCNVDQLLESDYLITGVGGCVLMKRHIKAGFLELDDFITIAPRTDDVWLSKILELSSTSVFCCPTSLKDVQEIYHSNFALTQFNNITLNGGVGYRIVLKIRNKIFGYFGVSLANNDVAIRKTDNFFDDMKIKDK